MKHTPPSRIYSTIRASGVAARREFAVRRRRVGSPCGVRHLESQYEYPPQATRSPLKRGTSNHPKVYALCEELNISRPAALGYLQLLWDFTSDYAPEGNIGKYPDSRIEAAMDWKGRGYPKGKLIEALTKVGWIDLDVEGKRTVHDWIQHCEKSVHRRIQRNQSVTPKVTPQNGVSDPTNERLPKPLPLPEPITNTIATALPRGMALDEQYAQFKSEYLDWAPHMIQEDFLGDCWRQWCLIDGLQRAAAVAWIVERKRTRDPAFAPKPAKFIRGREWTRPDPPEPKKPEAVPFSQRELPDSRWNWGAGD